MRDAELLLDAAGRCLVTVGVAGVDVPDEGEGVGVIPDLRTGLEAGLVPTLRSFFTSPGSPLKVWRERTTGVEDVCCSGVLVVSNPRLRSPLCHVRGTEVYGL